MSTRREAREWAVQLLFQLDLNSTEHLDEVFSTFWAKRKHDPKSRKFAEAIVAGVCGERDRLDSEIQGVAEHWDLHRMGVVDRNVLRMSLHEMLHHPDVPPAVAINEAVDIAKLFGTPESGKFVNGILDRLRKNLKLEPR